MFINKTREVRPHKWTSKSGKTFDKYVPVNLCHFTCDNCNVAFSRKQGDIDPKRLSEQYSHFCSNCGDTYALAAKKGRENKLVNLRKRIGKKWIDSCGYCCVYMGPEYEGTGVHGGAVREHILVMEKHIGRPIAKGEVIHHIDGNKANNEIGNLQLMSVSEHNSCHGYNDTLVIWMYNIGLVGYDPDRKVYVLNKEYCHGVPPPPCAKKRKHKAKKSFGV